MLAPRSLTLLSLSAVALGIVLALCATSVPRAQAGGDTDARIVDCLLPGQIRPGPSGAPVLGPRHMQKLSISECQTRGGEYTVPVAKPAQPAPAPTRTREDLQIVNCLLPAQLRQLGKKATYIKTLRPLRIARWDCRGRGGQSVTAARYKSAQAEWQAAVANSKK
jgi:hypothetical protein